MVMMVPFPWVGASLSGVRLHLRQRSVNRRPEVYNERVLQVRLLGGVAADRDGEQLSLLPPVSRLLAVLALRPGPQDRETVAATLWPGAAGPAARANLRTAVWSLRKAVGDDALITSRTAVGLRPEAITVDLADGQRRAAAGDAAAAAALCHGELLPGYAEDWAETARRRQRTELAETLATRTAAAERDGDAAGAARWSRLRCELDPLNEAAHADLVRQLAAAGDRAGALVAGREVTGRLRAELGVQPGPALRAALAEARGPAAVPSPVGPETALAPFGSSGSSGVFGSRPLYGRTAELRALMAAWAAARAGHGRVVLITGEAGIGKTRLVAELARRAENAGARTAVGAGVDVGGAAPLATWQELVPQLARSVPTPPEQADWPAELGRLAPDIATRLGRDEPPPPVSSPELERLRLFDAVLRLVEWAAAGRPVLLVAEDVHRADPASMQLCAHIGRRLAAMPVLFVLTRRDKPDRPDADALLADLAGRGVEVAELELGPLAAVELAAVARSVADLTDQAVDQVIRAADGNPLLAVESARALAAGRAAPPPNLRTAVRAATGALARPARDLAEMLAAAGRELSAAELAAAYLNLALTDRDAAEAAVLDTGLVVRVRGGLRFRHALLAEAVRADLGEQGRRYEQLALAIEAAAAAPDQVAAEVAGHLHRAGRDDLAGPRWQRAARHARSLGAMPEAARFWAEAVRCDPEEAALRLELAEALGWLGQDADFEREWQAALDLLPEERQSVAWSRRGQVHRTVVCNPRASLAAYQRAAELLPADAPPSLRTEILLGTAWGESAAGDPARAAELLDQVASLVTEPDDRIVAEMANAELMSVIRLGRFSECETVAARGAAAARRAGRPLVAFGVWIQTACALSGSGDLTGALRAADAAVAATRGMTVIEFQCLAARAFVLSRLGRHAEALSLAREQLALAERMDSPAIAARARHDAGLISLAAGRHLEAAHLLEQALAEGAEVSRPAARLAQAEALARSGRPDEATAEVRRAALEPVRSSDQPWALVPRMTRVQGLIALARGDRAGARRRLTEAADGWRRHLGHHPGEEFVANFVDLGRPPIVGLVEPEWELRRLTAELAGLDELTEVP
jgi:DNA-binding SARP family transcriptional activator/tetratricopeptide (TPR) repeat protein